MSKYVKGFDELENKFSDMQKASKKLANKNRISFDEIFTDSFMAENTKFSTIDLFWDSADIHTEKEFKEYPDEKLDIFVKKNTNFSSWKDMQEKANLNYIGKELGF